MHFQKMFQIKITGFEEGHQMTYLDFGSEAHIRSNKAQVDFFDENTHFYCRFIFYRKNKEILFLIIFFINLQQTQNSGQIFYFETFRPIKARSADDYHRCVLEGNIGEFLKDNFISLLAESSADLVFIGRMCFKIRTFSVILHLLEEVQRKIVRNKISLFF